MNFHVKIDSVSDETAVPNESIEPEKMRIIYWNMSNSADYKRTLEYFTEIVKPDLILLSNMGKYENPHFFPPKDFHLLHIGNSYSASENVHCILVRVETIRPHVLDLRGWGSTVFQFQSIDIQLQNGVHRVILVHTESEEATLDAIPGIADILTPEDNCKVEFVHLLGTLNSTEYRLQNVLPEGFHSILDPEWETNEKRQDDISLSKRMARPQELEGHVLGHKTFRWPRYEPRNTILIEVGKGVSEGNNLFCCGDDNCKERSCDWFKHDYDEDDYLRDDYRGLFEKKKANGVPLLGDT